MAASLWDEALLELQARLPSIIQARFDLGKSTCPLPWSLAQAKIKIILKNKKCNLNLFRRVEDKEILILLSKDKRGI